MGVLGHELGHVKSGHMLYHTLGEALSGGISLSASLLGLDILSIPIRLALLSWHRESEVTADRASLLAVDDIAVIKSLMTKLAALPRNTRVSPRDFDIEKDEAGMLESFSELFKTHPLYANRFRRVKEYAESEEFLRATRKIELRQNLLKALVPLCRHCGEKKRLVDLFCPSCGRCQT
jgi:Zn-dependent protease with chaperone function